jgi:regulator of protease activity HflC (stomatin/prohibitin superfamily)
MIRERATSTISGWLMLPVLVAGLGLSLWQGTRAIDAIDRGVGGPLPLVLWLAVLVLIGVLAFGFFIVNPNEARVLTLFGKYGGSVKHDGFHWANPFYVKRHISLRIRNFESAQIKVNDLEGNPIEIASVVVWRVVETAEAVFEVDNYEHYVKVQTEAAVRNLATHYPYDAHLEGHM